MQKIQYISPLDPISVLCLWCLYIIYFISFMHTQGITSFSMDLPCRKTYYEIGNHFNPNAWMFINPRVHHQRLMNRVQQQTFIHFSDTLPIIVQPTSTCSRIHNWQTNTQKQNTSAHQKTKAPGIFEHLLRFDKSLLKCS